jgi:hypothetical protein
MNMRIKKKITMTVHVAEPKCDIKSLSPASPQDLEKFFEILYEWYLEDKGKTHES